MAHARGRWVSIVNLFYVKCKPYTPKSNRACHALKKTRVRPNPKWILDLKQTYLVAAVRITSQNAQTPYTYFITKERFLPAPPSLTDSLPSQNPDPHGHM